MTQLSRKETGEIIEQIVPLAVKAGSAVLDVYRAADPKLEVKGDGSPLTEADRRSHRIIVEWIRHNRTEPVLSEESAVVSYAERKQWRRFWLIDPLDGTKEFISRNGEFTVNIALIEEGRPVIGVVYAPVLEDIYVGGNGIGAWRLHQAGKMCNSGGTIRRAVENDTSGGCATDDFLDKLEVAVPKPGAQLRVVASRSHRNTETNAFIAELEPIWGPVDLVSKGSSLKLCMVAAGEAHIYPRIAPTMEWDTAAAQAVVEGAGGRVLQHGTETSLTYNKESLLNPWFIVTSQFNYKI